MFIRDDAHAHAGTYELPLAFFGGGWYRWARDTVTVDAAPRLTRHLISQPGMSNCIVLPPSAGLNRPTYCRLQCGRAGGRVLLWKHEYMFPVDGNSTHAHRHTGITLHTYLGSFAGIKVAVAVAVAEANDASI